MTRLTKTQSAILEWLCKNPYTVTSQRVAKPLLAAGLVRPVTLSPLPRQGIAVRITAKGRGWLMAAR